MPSELFALASSRNVVRGLVCTSSLLAALLTAACSSSGVEEEVPLDVLEPPATPSGVSTEALRLRPTPDYTPSELVLLAESPEVKGLDQVFAAAPKATRGFHVTASDGTRIAVDLYFPQGFAEARDQAAVIYVEGWYGRGVEPQVTAIDLYRAAGFIVAIVDPRGFGASFGHEPAFLDERVRADQRELIDWFSKQPWSNGKVVAAGFSISATHAEASAASGHPALAAAVIRASDFDQYSNNAFPGGVPNLRMNAAIAGFTDWMLGAPCLEDLSMCGFLNIRKVDADSDFSLLRAAFLDHQDNLQGGELAQIVYRDDALGTGSTEQMSPVGHLDAMRSARVPARISASWLDGTTAESALARFRALPQVPMQVVIGATSHFGGIDADSFSRQAFMPARPGAPEQYAADVAFVQSALAGSAVRRGVSYLVLGANTWKSTPVWPPAHVTTERLRFSRDGLVESGHGRAGERRYRVDPSTSSDASGSRQFNRWGSQHGEPVYYGDRRLAPGRRLAFDAEAVTRDTELVGSPELCLALRSDQTDGIVIAYLEDVAPDGRVTYLTEGELRLIHRKTRSGGCDDSAGTERSFDRADGAPVIPGELMQVELPLLPVAALIRKGHHLRLSLAGADAGTFPMLTDEPALWSVAYGGRHGSRLTVPLRRWSRH